MNNTKQQSEDDSNPQQGTTLLVSNSQVTPMTNTSPNIGSPSGSHQSKFKISATRRDDRKLFVGGLPPEGKMYS